MAVSTYSFGDIKTVISHPDFASLSLYNEGIGDMTVSKANDNTAHDTAADGSVMVSKIIVNNGTVTINAQQTSPLHTYLNNLYNYLKTASTNKWAQIQLDIRAPYLHEQKICTGGSFQKDADTPYQAQGQKIIWTLMFADITTQKI